MKGNEESLILHQVSSYFVIVDCVWIIGYEHMYILFWLMLFCEIRVLYCVKLMHDEDIWNL